MKAPWFRALIVWLLASLNVAPAVAGPGDKAGWSVGVDPRGRAFLTYVAQNDGPRLLVLGCLRDADDFIVLSEDMPDAAASDHATLTLVNGQTRYEVDGAIAPDGVTQKLGFSAERDFDAKARRGLTTALLPVLEAPRGPIVLTAGPRSADLPVAGLGAPLKRFKSICFSR
jgi:hypothetical protein